MSTKAGLTLALVVGAALAGGSGEQLERMADARQESAQLLYLPNGRYLKVASLGQAPLLADLYYLWAIQYYSNYDRADRYRYVEHVFSDVIAELDPNYVDAYWLGALILSVEAHDLDAALQLLDKGLERNPSAWVLPYLAGWECHFGARYEQAAGYFRVASGVPGAPPMVRRMIGGMERKAGNLRRAIAEWTAVLQDPASDRASRAIAERQLRDLQAREDVQELTSAVERFRERNGRYPESLARLRLDGYIGRVPRDPDGAEYLYDPSTGRVTSSAGRVLGGR